MKLTENKIPGFNTFSSWIKKGIEKIKTYADISNVRKYVRSLVMVTSLLWAPWMLTWCGGWWSWWWVDSTPTKSNREVKTWIINDGTVEWAKYQNICVEKNGKEVLWLSWMTNSAWEFEVEEWCTVEFYVWWVKIWDLRYDELNSDQTATLQDIVWVARSNTSDPRVVEIAQFLQSIGLNEDGTITITPEIFNKLKDLSYSFASADVTDAWILDDSLNVDQRWAEDILNKINIEPISASSVIWHLDLQAGLIWVTPNEKPTIEWNTSITLSTDTPYFNQLYIEDSDWFISDVKISWNPSWLSLDKDTNQISWTPTEAGTFTYTITVIDNQWLPAIKEFTINVTNLNTTPTEDTNTTTITPTEDINTTTITPTEDINTTTPEINYLLPPEKPELVWIPWYESDWVFRAWFKWNPWYSFETNWQRDSNRILDKNWRFSIDIKKNADLPWWPGYYPFSLSIVNQKTWEISNNISCEFKIWFNANDETIVSEVSIDRNDWSTVQRYAIDSSK